jgi:hypothetical protein
MKNIPAASVLVYTQLLKCDHQYPIPSLTSLSRVLLNELTVALLVKDFHAFLWNLKVQFSVRKSQHK